ncbi:autotransporter outer membrane beta-barrel domain-containing protein [Rickettsia endosymbiont of Cantharis rufa]|uniref:autotransporter outer membrane beta-barrel domain-containing protein n=1 Tax=Rickettsia endosymbiont of Cantharis rufa TaxID=3066248 RepID=UPI0031330139
MVNISPKLFQKAIQIGLKTALFTTSTATLMLSSSGVLGVEIDVTDNVVLVEGDATNLSQAWANNNSLKLTGVANNNIITGQDNLIITGVDSNGKVALFTVTHDQITIDGALDMNLTLTNAAGNVAVGSVHVGDVSVAGGALGIGAAGQDVIITGGTVNQTGAIGGDLTVSGGGVYVGTVAADVAGEVDVQADAGAVTIHNSTGNVTVAGSTLAIVDADADMTITGGTVNQTGTIGGNLAMSNGGVLNGTAGAMNVGGTVLLNAGFAGQVTINNANGLVTTKGGTLTLNNAVNGINFATGAAAGTTVNIIGGGNSGDVDNTTGGNTIGTITFKDIGAANDIGATNSLAVVNVGGGEVTINGAVMQADAINLTDDASALTFANAVVVTGAIDNTGNADNGVVTFTGNSTVTGNIGTAALATVNVGAGITLQAGGNLTTNNIDFGVGSILEFNGAAGTIYKLSGTIANGNNAILNVNTENLTAYHPTIGTVAQINIGAGNLFSIDVSAGDVTILDAQDINFGDAASRLDFSNATGAATKNVLLAGDLDAFGGGGGDLFFDGGAKGLNVGSNVVGTPRNIGDAGGDKFDTLSILSKVTITKDINLAGIQALVLRDDADFTDYGNSSVNIAAIEINDAIYTIDANDANVNVPAANIGFSHEDATLVLQNSSNANDRTITLGANINPNNPDEGIVILNSVNAGKKLTIAGGVTLGGPNRLQAIVFQGAGDFDTTGIIFNTTDIGLNTSGAIKLGTTTANVTLLNDAVQLTQTGNIGGFLDFKGKNATVTLNDGVNIIGAVQNTGGNNNGTLIALGASKLGSVNGIAMLKVGAEAASIGGADGEIKIGEIQGNGTALLTLPANFKLTGAINSGGGDPLKLSFSGNSSVSGVVGAAASPVGGITTSGTTSFASSVNANGTTTLSGTISFADTFTNTGAVTLAKDSINNFAKDVTATSFVADGSVMNFGNSLAFNSDITGSGTTLTLGANQVTYTGTGSFTDTLTLNTTFDGAAKSGGNILIKSGGTLDLSGASTLALVVTATNFDINNISPDTKYTVISAETAGGLKPTPAGNVKITINNDNRFVDFTFDASTLTLFAEDIAGDVIDEDFELGGLLANIPNAANVKKSLESMEQAPNGSDARLAFADWGNLNRIQEADAVTHLMQNVVKPSEVVTVCSQAISGNILGNLTSINTRISTAQAAAGDEDMDAKFGGWINPFVGNATQKKIQNISGYKSDTTGGTLGFDALINDDAVLGLAYTRAETDVKLKDTKSGDKNKVRSNIFSLYGLYNLPQSNFFVEGVASYGDSKVTSKSRRVISTGLETIGYQTASGKYKSENYTGQLMAGYTYALPETVSAMPLVVTPMTGIRYSDIKDKGYKETGTTYQNLLVKGKNYNTFDGLLGGKVSSNINVSEVVLTPALYAMVDYAFKNKAPAIDARLQGMTAPFPTNNFKPKKTSFDFGVGVTAKHKMMEYGINYDINIGSKYFAQQGNVKVRVNF